MKNVITIGEAMGLFVADELGSLTEVDHYTRYSAGAEMNVAIGLARLGLASYYVTQLGADPIGKYLKKSMEKEKIQTDFVFFTDHAQTGFMIKEKVLEGDPLVFSYRTGSAASKFTKGLLKDLDFSIFNHIHLSGIFLALSKETKEVSHYFLEMAKKYNIRVTFDPNLRPGLWRSEEEMISTINNFMYKCEIILPGITEGQLLSGLKSPKEIAEYYLNKGVQTVIIKLGAEGAYVQAKDVDGFYINSYKVDKIVDTVGAGDGFAVGIISALVENLSLKEAVRRAAAIGALQVMSPGDNDGLPNKEQLKEFMNLY